MVRIQENESTLLNHYMLLKFYISFVTVCKYCENDLSVPGHLRSLQSRIFIHFAPSFSVSWCLELCLFFSFFLTNDNIRREKLPPAVLVSLQRCVRC